MPRSVLPAVIDMIAEKNPAAATRFARDFEDRAFSDDQVIRELNRYWRHQLMSLHSSTISARACLVDDIDPRDWLRHFENLVLPTIVNNDLPTRH